MISGLQNDPASALEFCSQFLVGVLPQRELSGRAFGLCRHRGCLGFERSLFELFDERVRFLDGELAAGLSLAEPHRASCVAEIAMTGLMEQRQQLFDLSVIGGRSRVLSEGHAGQSLTPL